MKIAIKYIFMFIILSLSISQENELPADDLLISVMNRLRSIDLSYTVDFSQKQKGKLEKKKTFQSMIRWLDEGEIEKMIFVKVLKPKKLKAVKYWKHQYRSDTKVSQWMTMPITGKLKDISNKKTTKNDFNFSELELTRDDITSHENRIIGEEIINGRETIIIESIKKKTGGKEGNSKKLWIDAVDHFITKVEFYNKKHRLTKRVTCNNILDVEGILFFTQIQVSDLKKKKEISINIRDISLGASTDVNLFTPRGRRD